MYGLPPELLLKRGDRDASGLDIVPDAQGSSSAGRFAERARVEIEHVSPHGGRAWARLIALEEPSPHRTRDPDAPGHRCGG